MWTDAEARTCAVFLVCQSTQGAHIPTDSLPLIHDRFVGERESVRQQEVSGG